MPIKNSCGSASETETSNEFGDRLRELRKGKRWSQQEVAEQLGVSRPYVAGVELGKQAPFQEPVIRKAAALFGVDPEELLELARRFKSFYRLAGTGMSETHQTVGALLEERWEKLDERSLHAIGAVVRAQKR